ncbi:HEAT repeat-containing protein 1, partial [Stegodyphus mimosarum]
MDALQILNLLFEFCIIQMNSLKGILSESFRILQMEFIHVHFSDIKRFFWFLSHYWCNFNEQYTTLVHLASLKITETYFQQPIVMDWFFDSYVPFISLIKAVVSPVEDARAAALNLLSSLVQNTQQCEYALRYLAEDICRNSEEIKVDLRQCFYVIHDWLAPAAENSNAQDSKLPLRSLVLENFLKIMSDNHTPYDVKYFILSSLEKIDSVNLLSAYIPVLKHFIKQLKDGKESSDGLVLNIVKLLLSKYTPKTASCLVDKKIETVILFECLQCVIDKNLLEERGVEEYDDKNQLEDMNEEDDKNQLEEMDVQDDKIIKQPMKDRSVQLLTLKIITKEFFSAIPSSSVQQKLLNTLIELYITSTTDINSTVGKVLRKLCTYAHLLLKDFQMAELVASKGTSLKEMKKSKIKEIALSENSNELNKGPWKKVIVLLEIIQNKKNLEKRELLIPELFQLLNKSLNFDSSASVEYLRQLILSTIYNCCQELGTSGLDERQFQVELIVQCIRSSTNPKTHHESLLLLNLAASMFPDYVLSNVMSIFTFMGSSLVRQDDSYSFQVISQTIETIVPSLLAASSHQEESKAIQVVASVIRVFVESLSDIPGHRQLPLFTKLITTLDASKYLWIPLGQICDQYATVFHNITSEDVDNWKIAPTLEFAINLHKHFSPSVQMDTCIKLINFLGMLPDSKEDLETNAEVISKFKEPFNVIGHSDKQLQVYKHNVLSYINIWLSSQAFVSQVSELDLKAQYSLEEKYEQLLEATLSYLQHQINISKLHANNLMPLLYNLVNHINSLLP